MKARLLLIPAVLLLCVACKPKPERANVPTNAGAADQTTPVKVDRQLGSFESLSGTPYQMAAIVSTPEKRGLLSSGKGSWRHIHNYLFFDTDAATFTKLLDTNRTVIAKTEQFPIGKPICPTKQPCRNQPKKVKTIVYTVIKQDTNGDKELTPADAQTLAVSDPNGKNYTELVQADVINHKVHKSATQRLLVMYRRDGKRLLDVIDLTKKQVIETKALPPLGADVK